MVTKKKLLLSSSIQRAISYELLDLEPLFIYENNSINLFYNTKKPGCITSNRKYNKVRLAKVKKTKGRGDTIRQILEGGHYYVGDTIQQHGVDP